MCVCSVAQSCLTLCKPMDCSQPDSSPLSMKFSRQEYWSRLPLSCSRGSSWDQTHISCISCISNPLTGMKYIIFAVLGLIQGVYTREWGHNSYLRIRHYTGNTGELSSIGYGMLRAFSKCHHPWRKNREFWLEGSRVSIAIDTCDPIKQSLTSVTSPEILHF